MNLKRLQEIITARFTQFGAERERRAEWLVDADGNPIDSSIMAMIDKLVSISLRAMPRYDKLINVVNTFGDLFETMVDRLRPVMEKLTAWSYQESAMIFTNELPRAWLAARVRQVQREQEKPETPLDKIHEMSKAEYEKLVQRFVLPPRSKEDVKATMDRKVLTVRANGEQVVQAWDERILDLSRKVNPAKVANEIVTAAENGETAQQLAGRLLQETQGIGASAKRIARTEIMRQMGDAAEQSYNGLGEMYVGMQYTATMDEVVRPEHAILNGRIWYRDGREPDISVMPRPPIAANCRCGTIPVLAPPREALEDPNWLAQTQAAGQAAHPDAQTQQEWFANADEPLRRISVGAKRYRTVQSLLGRDPEWTDFIDTNGRILSIKELQNESERERDIRREKIKLELEIQKLQLSQVSRMGFVLPASGV